MNPAATDFKNHSAKALIFLKEDLKTIRTGKVSPSLIENITVQTYGGQAQLKLLELGTTAVESQSTIAITPFDPATISDIEKALLKSPLGINPLVQGNRIIVKFPALSQEQREKLVKLVNQKTEERKNIIRGFRDEARKKIKQLFESKEITEDEKFRIEKDIDSETQRQMQELQKIRETKEKEIMEI